MSTKSRIFQNNLEKYISSDDNSRQNLQDKARAQLVERWLIDPRRSGMQYPGVVIQDATLPIYQTSVVFSGLMVQPGTSSLLIQPGVVAMLFAALQGGDDSPVVVIDDAGQQTAGILEYTANGTGSVRWDLVEARPYLEQLQESRDIWDEVSRAYIPTLVPKRCTVRLQYRIRTGTSPEALPALQSDWLPLAAIHVPASAASFDECDFYDVRPLADDMMRPAQFNGDGSQGQVGANLYSHLGGDWQVMDDPDTSDRVMAGHAEAVFGGYLAGGELRQSMPSAIADFGAAKADQNHLSLARTDNKQLGLSYRSGSTSVTATYWVAALFPLMLPRWVRYSQSNISSVGRVPRGPRGLLVVMDYNGLASTHNNGFVVVTQLPAVLGLSIPCMGVILAGFGCDGSGVPQGSCRGNKMRGNHAGFVSTTRIAETSPGSGIFTVSLRPSFDYPPGSKEVRLELWLNGDDAAGARIVVSTDLELQGLVVPSVLDTQDWAEFGIDVQLPAPVSATDAGNTATPFVVTVNTNGWGNSVVYAIVRGWVTGP